jgi:hypothetical protein
MAAEAPSGRRTWRVVVGWSAVALNLLVSCFWAFWGAIENFHEGWYSPSLLANLGLMLAQYLSPMVTQRQFRLAVEEVQHRRCFDVISWVAQLCHT